MIKGGYVPKEKLDLTKLPPKKKGPSIKPPPPLKVEVNIKREDVKSYIPTANIRVL